VHFNQNTVIFMKLLTIKELEELSQVNNDHCISIYMPTHRAGKEVLNQNDARLLKNHYQEIKKALVEEGMHEGQAVDLLEPISKLIGDSDFWRHQIGGLAIFLAKDFFRYHRLPISFSEFHLITHSFYLKPLAQTFSDDEYYFIMALSLKNVRLFEASRYFIHEINLHDLFPEGVEQILDYYQFEESLQFRSKHGGMNSGENAQYYGQGGSKQDVTPYIEEYFRHIDNALSRVMTSSPRPMILAAVDYLHPIFKGVTKTSNVVDEGIMGNPDHKRPDELHEASKKIMEPYFKMQRKRRLEKYSKLAGTGKTSQNLEEIAQAAINGRVEALFVAKGSNAWGRIYENNGDVRVELHPEFQNGDNCLIDRSVVKTLLNGGETYLVEKENIIESTTKTDVAAVFRY
jgi:hypothetical protein